MFCFALFIFKLRLVDSRPEDYHSAQLFNPTISASLPYLGPPRVRSANIHENLGACEYRHTCVSTFASVQNEIIEHELKSINLLRV